WSVAINERVAIIGARGVDDNGMYSGAAYLFDLATGRQIAKLLPDDGDVGDDFGDAVAMNENTAIVGAYDDYVNGVQVGSAYLFDTDTGEQITKLLPDHAGSMFQSFGYSVAISDTTAIVGDWGDDDNGFVAGAAYLYDVEDDPGPGDLDADDQVGAGDLVQLLIAWGACADCSDCGTELDDDCMAGMTDLLILLANWCSPAPTSRVGHSHLLVGLRQFSG
ncbi:MAG: hypothetical protein ACYTGG_05335, partial [Planctomycetota bacterium]